MTVQISLEYNLCTKCKNITNKTILIHWFFSENVGKAEFIFGDQHGMIGLLAKGETYQCITLNMEIQGGTDQIEKMDSTNDETCNNSNKEFSRTSDSKTNDSKTNDSKTNDSKTDNSKKDTIVKKINLAYTYIFKIEVSLKYLKHTLGGFCYHVWTNALPKISRYCTINDLSNVVCIKKQKRILDTLIAIEVFTFLSSVAYGIMTIVALNYSDNIWSKYTGLIRIKSSKVPSLETVRATLLKEYYNISLNLSIYATLHNINKYRQNEYEQDKNCH